MIDILKDKKVILASKSPRRVEILTKLGIEFTAVGSTFPELLAHDDFDTPADYAMTNAREKALEVYRTLTINGQQPPDLVIGADTVVVYEPPAANAGERAIILEKPNDEAHAKQMLITLRNAKTHGVVTGMCFVFPPSADVVEADDGGDAGEPKVVTFFEHTSVTFGSQVTDAMIDAYVATGDPLDKAGAYGYQSKAMFLVERIDGCHFNVVGLPVYRMVVELQHHIK
ncbi:N-acetylserotonin O-methyltransferase-like protein-like protein [Catenaria anguillulae PL171]|uniref:N-acetylserotonin O-methyltransferase-like protein-like protein n=1 Tax=Catenaria anguillulae PL171 TaxID=765915 RepID=A0A1Y2HS20_9FUNG|nr:N-acetylserotonin O-methyltransferase-like protein-like protein [Catenaria anguillulae PL171]